MNFGSTCNVAKTGQVTHDVFAGGLSAHAHVLIVGTLRTTGMIVPFTWRVLATTAQVNETQ